MKYLVFVLALVITPIFAYEGKVAFDLDETLIESTELDLKHLDRAQALGYKVETSKGNQDYIVRPGAFELLDYAVSQGFTLMIMTHNRPDYAKDILESSGLDKYFSEVRTMADCKMPYNLNFQRFPYHRNKVHKTEKSDFERYISTFYHGFIEKNLVRLQGNKNIHPYLPCLNCDKYPPLYGARVLFDNSSYNIEDAVDFAGVKVAPFYAQEELEKLDSGEYKWVEAIKSDLDYLKNHTWIEFYRFKFSKDPVNSDVPLIK